MLLSGCEFEGAYDLPLPGSPVDEDDSFEVTAEFADVLNVVPRSVVMVDDVTVGEVIEVDRVGWHARITMRIKDGTELPDNAIADIRQSSACSARSTSPSRTRPTETPSGQPRRRRPHPALLHRPQPGGRGGARARCRSCSAAAASASSAPSPHELNKVMDGRTDRLRHLLGSLESVIGTIDSQRAQIISALESMNGLAKTLNAERETIGDALDAMGPAVEVLAAQHDELIEMLGALDRLGVVGTRVIGASKDNLIKTLADLRPVLDPPARGRRRAWRRAWT